MYLYVFALSFLVIICVFVLVYRAVRVCDLRAWICYVRVLRVVLADKMRVCLTVRCGTDRLSSLLSQPVQWLRVHIRTDFLFHK